MQAALARPAASQQRHVITRAFFSVNKTSWPGELTSGVGGAPKDDGTILVLLSTEDVVEANGEAVEVANVQRAKVVVEGIVQEGVVNRKVAGRRATAGGGRSAAFSSSLRTLPRRLGRRREEGIGGRRVDVGGKVQTVWEVSVRPVFSAGKAQKLIKNSPGMYSMTWPIFWEWREVGAMANGSLFLRRSWLRDVVLPECFDCDVPGACVVQA